MFIFLHRLYFFLWEGQGHFFGDKDQISSGGGQMEGVRGRCVGRSLNEGFFCKVPFSEIQTLSHKLLVRETSNCHHWNWHAQKPNCKNFQVILCSSSWSKITLCILKKQICLPIGNAMEKNIFTRKKC